MKEILHDKCIPAAVSYYFSASQVGLKWSHSKTANIAMNEDQEKIVWKGITASEEEHAQSSECECCVLDEGVAWRLIET